jgi:uncharacterized protein (DUF1778 family)
MPKTVNLETEAKEMRLNVRINREQKAIIARAAQLRGATVSNFVIEKALQAASQIVAEETRLQMTPQQFKQFCRLLDAPPAKNLRAMQKLLNEPSVLDE